MLFSVGNSVTYFPSLFEMNNNGDILLLLYYSDTLVDDREGIQLIKMEKGPNLPPDKVFVGH